MGNFDEIWCHVIFEGISEIAHLVLGRLALSVTDFDALKTFCVFFCVFFCVPLDPLDPLEATIFFVSKMSKCQNEGK